VGCPNWVEGWGGDGGGLGRGGGGGERKGGGVGGGREWGGTRIAGGQGEWEDERMRGGGERGEGVRREGREGGSWAVRRWGGKGCYWGEIGGCWVGGKWRRCEGGKGEGEVEQEREKKGRGGGKNLKKKKIKICKGAVTARLSTWSTPDMRVMITRVRVEEHNGHEEGAFQKRCKPMSRKNSSTQRRARIGKIGSAVKAIGRTRLDRKKRTVKGKEGENGMPPRATTKKWGEEGKNHSKKKIKNGRGRELLCRPLLDLITCRVLGRVGWERWTENGARDQHSLIVMQDRERARG